MYGHIDSINRINDPKAADEVIDYDFSSPIKQKHA